MASTATGVVPSEYPEETKRIVPLIVGAGARRGWASIAALIWIP